MGNINYKGKSITSEELFSVFRLIAGTQLRDCTSEGFDCLKSFKEYLCGSDKDLTAEVLANSLVMITGSEEGNIYSIPSALVVGAYRRKKGTLGSLDISSILGELDGCEYRIEGYKGDYVGDEIQGISFSDEEEEVAQELVQESKNSEESLKTNIEEDKEVESKGTTEDPKKEAICRYYSSFYTAAIANIIKKYTALFESGYEVNSPDGILCRDGIVRVAGSHRKVYEESIATTTIYQILCSHMSIKERDSRSITRIGNDIWEEYNGNRSLLYFPNKMLEYAYGLEAPTGENQDSLNTYNRHATANSWSGFRNGELEKSIRMLCKGLMYGFVLKTMEANGIEDYKDNSIANTLQDYMTYVESCMSVCFLYVDYKFDKVAGEGQLSKFTLRVCDPTGKMLSQHLTQEIIQEAFLRNAGKDAYTYKDRIEPDAYMIEYAHEFNHALAQATPLFAYKALQALMRDGKSISWDNLILGKGEDGKILKCGKDGFINLAIKLLHFMSAGSRAGKGVMTLNFLASAVSSRKNLLYLDRKPDMASILRMICPEMFVVNGGGYDAEMDAYNQWGPDQVSGLLNNIPREIYDILDCSASWDSLGDLFYMRALMLAIGIIVGRASGHGKDPMWGGEEGVALIVDEFSNFQNSYRIILNKMYSKIPDIKLNESRSDLSKDKITQAEFDVKYNDSAYYALSYVNALASSLDFLDVKGRAGFDALEVSRSDIIVIGQHLKDTPVDIMEYSRSFEQSTSSHRYQTKLSRGMKGAFNEKVNTATSSVPLAMISFHSSGADVFLGRNDQGYLAADKTVSKACGRLDDKASNFAYYSNLSPNVLKDLHSNDIANIRLADNCKYFKPYLILNDGSMDSSYVRGVVSRCQTNAGITEEELVADNPDPENPNIMHRAIGLLEYIKMSGVEDYQSSMGGGAIVAQNVVSALGYPGTWLEFVCDLRPEWIFTIKDIENIAQNKTPALSNPSTNPILKEWVDFNPQRFGGDYVDPESFGSGEMNQFLVSDNTVQDYSDPEKVMQDGDERLSSAWDEYDREEEERLQKEVEDVFSEDGISLDVDEDYEENSAFEDYIEVDYSPEIQESGFADSSIPVTPEMQYYMDLVKQMQDQIQELQSKLDSGAVNENHQDDIVTREYENSYKSTEPTSFSEDLGSIDFNGADEVDSLDKLIAIISTDVVEKFGGLDRITSLRVVGGSLVVNGYYYRCNVKDMYARNIPYDIRRKVNSGNIAELFNYNLLYRMSRLRKLVIDSLSFAYDYVSPQLGIPDNVGVDIIFKSLPALQELVVSKELFTRKDYKEQLKEIPNGDIFYKVKRSTQLADISQEYLKKMNCGAWGFTKNIAKKENMNILLKSVGILAGVTGTATTGVFRGGVALGRKAVSFATSNKTKSAVKGFMGGFRDLFSK